MATFLTSDNHFNHANIIAFSNRPFESVDDMNWQMVERWNATVGPNDEVYHLGDFAMGNVEEALSIVPQLNGTIYLLPGNHDKCWRGHAQSKWKTWDPIYRAAGFRVIVPPQPSWITKTFGGIEFTLCHFPFRGNSRDLPNRPDRYSGHRPDDNGQWLIHGHTHSGDIGEGTQIHIGVDAWDYTPVNVEWILDLVRSDD